MPPSSVRSTALAAVLAAALTLASGCASDSASASEPPPECASLEAVQVSIEHLRNTNVAENGLSQLRANLADLGGDLRQLGTDARAAYSTQVDAVQAAADQLGSTLQAARNAPSAGTLEPVRTAAAALESSVRALADAMSGSC